MPIPAPAADPSPVTEQAEEPRQVVGWRLASFMSVTLGLAAPVLLWLGEPGWAWLAVGVALVLSRWFPGLIRFGLAYVGLKAIRAVVVFTASRRGELRGRGGRVCDPDAEWRRWLDA